MKKIDFTKFKLLDIDGKELTQNKDDIPVYKWLANTIYFMTTSIDIAQIAQKINNGEEVELRDQELEAIITIIESDKFNYLPFVKRQLLQFLSS